MLNPIFGESKRTRMILNSNNSFIDFLLLFGQKILTFGLKLSCRVDGQSGYWTTS